MSQTQHKVEYIKFPFLLQHLHHGLYAHQCSCPAHSCTAVDDERTGSGAPEVTDPLDERYNRMRVVGDTKIWPTGVMKLLHFTTIVALETIRRKSFNFTLKPVLQELMYSCSDT